MAKKTPKVPRLHTPREIAASIGTSTTKVLYIIRTRAISPAARLAHYRAFDAAAVREIGLEFRRMNEGRNRRHVAK